MEEQKVYSLIWQMYMFVHVLFVLWLVCTDMWFQDLNIGHSDEGRRLQMKDAGCR